MSLSLGTTSDGREMLKACQLLNVKPRSLAAGGRAQSDRKAIALRTRVQPTIMQFSQG